MSPEEEVIRGNEAAQVLGNPIYQEAMLVMRGQMMEEFTKTRFDQSEERDEIWRTMRCLDGLEAKLKVIMTTGKMGLAVNQTEGAPH